MSAEEAPPTISGYWVEKASAEEIFAVYDPTTWPTYRDRSGRSLLTSAVGRHDPETRALLTHRLLDDGADPNPRVSEGYTLLHVLLSRARDPEIDPPLVRHLIAAGADMNKAAGRHGLRPVEDVDHPKLSPAELEPYYRAFFDQPGLELLEKNRRGRSVLDHARLWRRKPQLLEHVMAYLQQIDQAPVDEPLTQTAAWQTLDEILARYSPADAAAVDAETGDSLLHAVLRNADLTVRTALVPRLVADGADVTLRTATGESVLHLALARHGEREAEQDGRVVAALLDAGADINAVSDARSVPLTTLALQGSFMESSVGPLYDALLAAPGLDLDVVVAKGRTVLEAVQKAVPPRPELLARLEARG
ncbi:ankyrin repeat protein [Sanguibacter keddieii DSM 10542]|uniref:Ankyrin repeat protein n=1 Tax=Sanguibacter keddieii (strain ATCC 51767 / DSM 10542 / NCFB 3025 / ST-74) TaxID=446469 RepID=D1BAE3_SANKS|nr:ankyrin repeat protein [Sanguibacter keddieii]ACZ20494.1 ankyrin repeat protein [Sanguibacter keddieii DSM 10542]